MDTLIVLIFAYIAIVGLAYAPRCPKAIDEIVAKPKKMKKQKYVDPNQLSINFAFDDTKTKKREPKQTQQQPNLQDKTIRELKKLASQAKIKRYSYLTKAELIQALMQTPQAA
ncbi:MAG: Rho termination factor N-terminal domain-containing protein [Snowella sp.]|nr:Rho termination factor N-terminal domain-containing protein [Snowella sp.]